MADTGPVSESSFDAAQTWQAQQAACLAEFTAGLAAANPHRLEMDLPPGLEEDGAALCQPDGVDGSAGSRTLARSRTPARLCR
jgi:hypothetical protein